MTAPETVDSIRTLSVPHGELRRPCDGTLQFETSDQLPAGKRYLGQQRATDAIRFGIQIDHDGYNIFVLGPAGSHRYRIAEELARDRAGQSGPPGDWCYVHNFVDSDRPRALAFAAGGGAEFRDDMGDLIEDLQLAISAAFEGEDYRDQLKAIESTTQDEVQGRWKAFEDKAAKENIGVLQTPTGYVLAPIRKGKVLSDAQFDKLPEAEREEIQATIRRLGAELQTHIEQLPRLRKEHRERLKALNRHVTEHAVGILLTELKRKYQALPAVVAYLDEVQRDIVDNAQGFRETEPSPLPFLNRDPSQLFRQYEVNLVVGNDPADTAPVVYEPNPSYHNIVGKVEHRSEMGALVTDFRMVRSGALLRANGGFLLLDMQRILSRPFAWEALKQALFTKRVRIESPAETYGFVSTTTLRPEPIPLDVKVILVGERWLYYMLCFYDSEFKELFKVAADLDDDLKRTAEHVEEYALLIADRIHERSLLPFSRPAVERVVEQRARAAGDNRRLSMHMRSLDDLLTQADYWARSRDGERVEPADVAKAIEQGRHRLSRTQLKVADAIDSNNLLIDTEGACVGQVNGLSVVDLGEHRFGHPVRITATTRIGTGNVVDIEREVELGGAIHSKGVMILSAVLSSRYAREIPLSLNGSIVFEQSYGGVEGDSASVAELSALLSSLSGIPIKQNLAVTGSINQLGRVQVVGGINEKIEGFYHICKDRGLDGSHGVIIPRENVKHLMLRDEVVEAVRDGRFSVYAVQNIDEALSILTEADAGVRDDNGRFPEESLNGRVEEQLIEYARLREQFGKNENHGERGESE